MFITLKQIYQYQYHFHRYWKQWSVSTVCLFIHFNFYIKIEATPSLINQNKIEKNIMLNQKQKLYLASQQIKKCVKLYHVYLREGVFMDAYVIHSRRFPSLCDIDRDRGPVKGILRLYADADVFLKWKWNWNPGNPDCEKLCILLFSVFRQKKVYMG